MLQWDASWYDAIRTNGIQYDEYMQSTAGFFPVFPYLWKAIGVNAVGMSLINLLVGLTALAMLFRAFKVPLPVALVILSLPSMFFIYVPYTESMFLLLGGLLLIGLVQRRDLMIAVGLFGCGLLRPTALFIVPAWICMEALSSTKSSVRIFRGPLGILLSAAAVGAGLFINLIIQFKQTGAWFAYFKAQSQNWDRSFDWPGFPLTTWHPGQLMWLDGAAFLIGVMTLAWLVSLAVQRMNGMPRTNDQSPLVLSLAYLALVLGSAVFFNDADNGRTSIFGINRYMLVSPFLVPVVTTVGQQGRFKRRTLTLIPIFLLFGSLIFGSYLRSDVMITTLGAILFISLFLVACSAEKNYPIWYILISTGLILQVVLFHRYLSGNWVG